MRKLLAFILVIGGATAGIGVGYGVATVEAVSNTPFLNPHHSNKAGFDGVVDDLAKLGGYESSAANCSGASPEQLALSTEAEIIQDLRGRDLKEQYLLHIAEARLGVRAQIIFQQDPKATVKPNGADRPEDLLKSAGWTNPSSIHMRGIIQMLDRDQCKQVVLPTAGQQ